MAEDIANEPIPAGFEFRPCGPHVQMKRFTLTFTPETMIGRLNTWAEKNSIAMLTMVAKRVLR